MSFWENSTDAQKLAQIDGGIECFLTIRQIAMNCGTTHAKLAYFGRKHDRAFQAVNSPVTIANARRASKVAAIVVARAARVPNVFMNEAFSIFGAVSDREPVIFQFGGDR